MGLIPGATWKPVGAGAGADPSCRPQPDSSRPVARARLALVALLVGWTACLAVALTKDPNPPFVPPPQATSDLDLYARVVRHVAAGEGYYKAAHRELLGLGYPTRSVFNWRLPTYAWLFARLPSPTWAHALLIVAALVAVVIWSVDLLKDEGIIGAGVGGVFLVSSMAWCCGTNTYLFTELWAGVLIVLSLAAFQHGRPGWGIAAGLLAALFRELALPYLVVSCLLAAWHRRKAEMVGWIVSIGIFAVYLFVHAAVVHARLTTADQALEGGWVRFGGIRFVLTTAQADVFLMSLPLWVTAVYVPLVILALLGSSGPVGERVRWTALTYVVAFCVVGAPFNFYWGFVYTPLLALGMAHAPRMLETILRAAGLGQVGEVRNPGTVDGTETCLSGRFATGSRAR